MNAQYSAPTRAYRSLLALVAMLLVLSALGIVFAHAEPVRSMPALNYFQAPSSLDENHPLPYAVPVPTPPRHSNILVSQMATTPMPSSIRPVPVQQPVAPAPARRWLRRQP